MTQPLFKINVGTFINLTKTQLIESVEIPTELEDTLEDRDYIFMNLGKRTIVDDTEYLLFPYTYPDINLFGKMVYSYRIDDVEVNQTINPDLDFFQECVEYRLLDALTSHIESIDNEYIEYEKDIASKSLEVISILRKH